MAGLLLAFPGIAHQLHWVSLTYLNQVHGQVQGSDEGVEQQAVRDGFRAYRELYVHLHFCQVQEQQENQSGENQPQDDGPCHHAGIDNQALPEHHDADVLLLQPQHAVQAQLLLAPLDQEAVGVIEEGHHDDPQQPEAYVDQYQGIDALGQVVHDIVLQYQVKDEVGEHGKGADADVGQVGSGILADVGDCHPGQQAGGSFSCCGHIMPPVQIAARACSPCAVRSACPISSGTSRRPKAGLCKSG